ncbi:putative serine protease inhibitor [Namao virus]|nr:putative serine protease inhibitor [Namao virus]
MNLIDKMLELIRLHTNLNYNTVISPLSLLILTHMTSSRTMTSQDVSTLHVICQVFEDSKYAMFDINNDTMCCLSKNLTAIHNNVIKLKTYCKNSVIYIDFINNPITAITESNAWIFYKTKKKDHILLNLSDVTPMIKNMIVNIMSFWGSWEMSFVKENTCQELFWINRTESVFIDTMVNSISVSKYIHFEDSDPITVIEIPYKGWSCSLYIIMANSCQHVTELEKRINNKTLETLLNMRYRKINIYEVHMPCFEVQSSISFILNSSDERLIHQTYFKVDESGPASTDAAEPAKTPVSPVGKILINRSFLYVVKHHYTDTLLLYGRYVSPHS